MKTKVFISWSGKNTDSFRVAKKLYDWLPMILQATEPFMSDNIAAGTDFLKQIMGSLATAKVGIICVTKENVASPWLNFEAGALSNVVTTNEGAAIPLLIGMTTDELSKCNSPIRNFHAVEFNDEGIEQMLRSINNLLEYPLKESQLEKLFEQSKAMFWDAQMKGNLGGIDEKIDDTPEEIEYIQYLREIVEKYKLNGSRPLLYGNGKYDIVGMELLEYDKCIETQYYIDGSVGVRPTSLGLKYVLDNSDAK